jgi:PTS system fructose-specific IIC component
MPERVHIGIKAQSKDDLFVRLVEIADQAGLLVRARDFLVDLQKTEGEVGTGTGQGMAVPHAESESVKENFIFVSLLDQPLDYDSYDQVPVDVVFFIGVRPGQHGLHMQFLARLGRMARQADLLKKIRAASSPQDICCTIRDLESQIYE